MTSTTNTSWGVNEKDEIVVKMGDNNTLLNPSEIRIKSDATCTVVVSGWYVRTILVGKH